VAVVDVPPQADRNPVRTNKSERMNQRIRLRVIETSGQKRAAGRKLTCRGFGFIIAFSPLWDKNSEKKRIKSSIIHRWGGDSSVMCHEKISKD